MTWDSRGKTAVVGIGTSKLSRKADKPLGLLALDACRAATEDAGIAPSEVDGIVTYPDQPFLGAGNRDGEDLVTVNFLIDHGGLAKDLKWYSQISSGMIPSAFIEGVNALVAGTCNYVLVWRAMHLPAGTYGAWRSNRASGDTQFTAPFGAANPFQWHGLAYQRYMHRFGAKREHMAALVTNSRANANLNEQAFFHSQPMTFEDYMNARMISDPLRLRHPDRGLHRAPANDGGSCTRSEAEARIHCRLWTAGSEAPESHDLHRGRLHGVRWLNGLQDLVDVRDRTEGHWRRATLRRL